MGGAIIHNLNAVQFAEDKTWPFFIPEPFRYNFPMSEPTAFKNYFDRAMAERLARDITAVYPDFAADTFVTEASSQLDPLELKARVAVFSATFRQYLPDDYETAVAILLQTLGDELVEEQGMFNDGWFVMPIAHFVELYGLDHFEVSVAAMKAITKRFSAEFAIRPYLQRYPDRLLPILHEWTQDPSPHVRRLVSEGTRPRLPWAAQLPQFIEDPTPTLALLEKLKDDPSAYVRKSVANHLNDIAKDHPQRVIETCARWAVDASAERMSLIRHALRTLVKAGVPDALAILGYGPVAATLTALSVTPDPLTVGETLVIDITLSSESDEAQPVLIDYAIHFLKANGTRSPKVFKWKTAVLPARGSLTLQKRQSIKPITTRRYYAGEHWVAVQVNGRVLGDVAFELLVPE